MEIYHYMGQKWVKNTILFLSSQTFSIFGSYLVQYAIMWHITLSTKSGTMITLYIMSGLIPHPFHFTICRRLGRQV